MLSKRGVIRTDATKKYIGALASFRELGALSGPLTGISFIGGVGGGWLLPTPRARGDPTVLHRELPLGPAQRDRTVDLDRFSGPVHRLGGEAGRTVREGVARASEGGGRRGRGRHRVVGDLGAMLAGAQRPLGEGR